MIAVTTLLVVGVAGLVLAALAASSVAAVVMGVILILTVVIAVWREAMRERDHVHSSL